MSLINQTYDDRVKYTLYHRDYGSLDIQEPDGWQTDDKEYARDKDYSGMFTLLSNNLKFSGSAMDFILLIDGIYGINADLRLTKSEQHPHTDLWEQTYEGWLDLSTKDIEDNTVSMKFNSGGIEQMIKTRESETTELDRTDTMDGKALDDLKIDTVLLKGRKILLDSRFEVKADNNTARVRVQSSGNTRKQTVGVPFVMTSQSHEEAQSVTPETNGNEQEGTTGMMFFEPAIADKTLNINLDLSFTVSVEQKNQTSNSRYYLAITKYTGNVNYDRADVIVIFDTDGNGGIDNLGGPAIPDGGLGPATEHSVTWAGAIDLLKDESLALEFYVESTLGSNVPPATGFLQIAATNITGKMSVIEDSFFEQSQSKFILAHELADRLVEIMTSKNKAVKSDYFGRTDIGYPANGPGAYFGFTHGFWVRQFDKLPLSTDEEINPFKPLSTSWNDFYTSMQAVCNIGLGIERIGRREYVRIEDLKYFFNRNVTIRLPEQVSKEHRTVATDYYYSAVEIGYEQDGKYEEAMGLDEYNIKSNYTTAITRLKNPYSKISKYRADSYGKEFARRKPKLNYPNEDTGYDDEVFVMDLKPGNGAIFEERVWQDDFQQAPTGVYSPDTATNLRLSPFNLMLRHGWVIAAGLTKYPSDYIRYGASTANSRLKTKLMLRPETTYINGNEYAENGNIVNSELERARYIPEWVEFEHKVDFEVSKMLDGNTVISGKKIPNVYGLVEFINAKGERERGYLFNVKPNDNGKWKILSFNKQ